SVLPVVEHFVRARAAIAIIDADEKEPVGWRSRSRLRPIAGRENLRHPLDRPTAAPDLDQRADNGADHVSEESCSCDLVGDQRACEGATGGATESTGWFVIH